MSEKYPYQAVPITAKAELGFYRKCCEDRQILWPAELIAELRKHTRRPNCHFAFPSPTGNGEQHMLDRCKALATRAWLHQAKVDLKTFRSTYVTRMLRQGADVRTVQHWMGHKSRETTMRYLVPATDVHASWTLSKFLPCRKRALCHERLRRARQVHLEKDGLYGRPLGQYQTHQLRKPSHNAVP